MNSIEFLDSVREKHGIPSYNKLAQFLGIEQARISQYTTARRKLDPIACRKVAESLGIDAAVVVAEIQLERTKCPEDAAVWKHAVDLLRRATAAGLLGFVLLGGLSAPLPADAATAASVYYVKSGICII